MAPGGPRALAIPRQPQNLRSTALRSQRIEALPPTRGPVQYIAQQPAETLPELPPPAQPRADEPAPIDNAAPPLPALQDPSQITPELSPPGPPPQGPSLAPSGGGQPSEQSGPSTEAREPLPPTSEDVPPKPKPKPPLSVALETPGDVTFRNMSIDAALFTIGETWNVNIIAGKEATGTVNGVFKQTSLREILDAVLLANGYSYRAVGESLVVQAADQVGSAHPLFRSLTLPIRHGDMQEIVEGAKLLASSTGQVKALTSARSILVIDYADRVESIAEFVSRMDEAASRNQAGSPGSGTSQLEVAYFHTHFISAQSAQQALMPVVSPLGRVSVMPRENRMLVVDHAANIAMVRKVLARIDRPRPQVRVTALIYDISLKDVETLGLNWQHEGKGNNLDSTGDAQQSLAFESTTIAPIASGAPGGAFTVRSLTRNFDIQTVLNLLQSASDARLLADPNVTVADNELAETKSVSEIPYQQITQSELGGQIGTTAFKEAGITLRVQPTIAGDGTIEMMVEPEFSRLAGFTPQENQPIIDTRKASTRVRVSNRQTVVISGLRQRSDTGEFTGIPFLKDVKYVGPLFRSRDTDVRESELIVFIMPEIVDYDQPNSYREGQAAETVACRLDGVPVAEGCAISEGGCDSGATGRLAARPPVESGDSATATGAKNGAPLRPEYDRRFRADDRTSGASVAARPAPADGAEKKSAWKRLIGR